MNHVKVWRELKGKLSEVFKRMGENRVEISAIFDLETLDFEFEHFFESYVHLHL